MYIGLVPKLVGNCIEHFSSSILADYIKIDKKPNIERNDSELEM